MAALDYLFQNHSAKIFGVIIILLLYLHAFF